MARTSSISKPVISFVCVLTNSKGGKVGLTATRSSLAALAAKGSASERAATAASVNFFMSDPLSGGARLEGKA